MSIALSEIERDCCSTCRFSGERFEIFMKKIILLVVLFLQIFTIEAYAGDMPEQYLAEDNAKIFTATIMNLTRETIDVTVIQKIKGEISENRVLTLPYFEYGGRKYAKPQVNESCLITMINDKLSFAIQTTSTDPKTLKFLNHTTNISMNMDGQSVYERMEQYVNDGSYEAAEQRRLSEIVKVPTNTQTVDTKNINNKHFMLWIYLLFGVLVSSGLLFAIKSKKKG